jgi:hypothetical protein
MAGVLPTAGGAGAAVFILRSHAVATNSEGRQLEVDVRPLQSAQAGLDSSAATPLHRHATSVWLLRDRGVVVRIDHSANQRRAELAVTITRWLLVQGFAAIEPIDVDQPVAIDAAVVTFWQYYPQNDRAAPGAGALGALLRRLHDLPQPPVALDEYVPLAHLGSALESGAAVTGRGSNLACRPPATVARRVCAARLGPRRWIHPRRCVPGNALWDGQLVRLGDWDEVARGPRELDLVNTHQGARFGRSAEERQAFNVAYGWDVTAWPGYPILREMRDLHTLGAFSERAARGDDAAAAELRRRVATLRARDANSRWRAS